MIQSPRRAWTNGSSALGVQVFALVLSKSGSAKWFEPELNRTELEVQVRSSGSGRTEPKVQVRGSGRDGKVRTGSNFVPEIEFHVGFSVVFP
jgi:hypothetical protein